MSVSLVRICKIRNCSRPANRVVVSRCDFRNQWQNRGTSLCRTHARQEAQYPGYVTEVSGRTDWQNEHITHVRPEPVTEKPRCTKCGRALRSAQSIRRGMGKECARKVRIALTEAEYSASQVASAEELISDGAIVQISAKVFRSVSSDGTAFYLTAVSGQCNCPAGLRGIRCYHSLAARILAGIPAPVSGPAIAIAPVRIAPAYLATVCQYGDTDPVTHTVKNVRGIQGLCASHAAGYGYPEYLTSLSVA
ncbi:DUF6011 domain-containing protein [Streptomyces sp. ISL-10]|uniref:DUF6011 domain-containing protein n=1 Tax=Streptomyces sp. ISL-10 TaxID=2819172 RepID=UPI0035ABBA38